MFEIEKNTNYQLLNLMMNEKTGSVHEMYSRSNSILAKTDDSLVKFFIALTVRNFFLNHDVKNIGEAQALRDRFFKNAFKIQAEIDSNRMRKKRMDCV